jgi:teichuronic acid biosynthesis glycosyltransferase TuaG
MSVADVSVVIPYFEAGDSIARCLASVAAQSLPVREVIVIDDGSAQPLALGGEPVGRATSLTVARLDRNRGAAAARNEGVRRARAKYIAFLDADDVWLHDKIRVQYALMEQRGWALSGHGYAATPVAEQPGAAAAAPRLRRVRRLEFAVTNPFFTPTVMVRRQGFAPFDEAHRRADDYKAWLENFSAGNTFLIERVLAHGFKPALGHSGLTGSVLTMHRDFIAVLASLRLEDKVSPAFYLAALLVEYVKLPLRWPRLWLSGRAGERGR